MSIVRVGYPPAVPGDGSVTDAKVAASANISVDKTVDGSTNHVFTAADDTKLAGIATGATANSSDATLLARANHTGTQSADTVVDGSTNHVFTAADDTKLGGIATGATANSSDATLLARANHTGTQSPATVLARVVAITFGSTITPNADTTDIATIALTGNVTTVAAPSGTPVAGQKLILRFAQDGTGSRTVTGWNAIYRFAGGTSPTLTTTASKTDYLGFLYNATDSKWDLLAERYAF